MELTNITKATHWFEVLQTSERAQTAMMKLSPGQSTGEKADAHESSDQVLLVLDGEIYGEIGDETVTCKKNDVVIIPAGVKHRFTNRGNVVAVTFNVYSPPEYPRGTKE
jgi:mannose-6-phosphate isomerase-like protein (cupin superfamily)